MRKYGPPEIFGNLEAMRFASETIFGPIRCFSDARQQSFICVNTTFLPIASYSTGFGFLIVCLFRKPHLSQMRFARLIVRLEEGEVVERKARRSFSALFAAISQVSPPSNGANWRVRKKVIRNNRPAATALNKVSLKSTVSDNHAVLNTEWQYSSSLYNAYQQNCKKYCKKSCNFHSIHFHFLPGGKFESNTRVAGKLSSISQVANFF